MRFVLPFFTISNWLKKVFFRCHLGRYSIVYDIFGFSRISRFAARRGLCLMQMRVSSWAGTKHRRTHSSHLSARVFSAMFYLLHLWCFFFNRELTSVDLIVFRSVYFFQKNAAALPFRSNWDRDLEKYLIVVSWITSRRSSIFTIFRSRGIWKSEVGFRSALPAPLKFLKAHFRYALAHVLTLNNSYAGACMSLDRLYQYEYEYESKSWWCFSKDSSIGK